MGCRVHRRPASNAPDQATTAPTSTSNVLSKGKLTQMFEDVLEDNIGGVRRMLSRERSMDINTNKRKTLGQSSDVSTRSGVLRGRCNNGLIQQLKI
mmetsp:Transcript_83782/g.166240  ORF Transcript_83782/g.166240 Transcript_83782/m.166240 type:complete len:96 (+) Transcript_83782:703-990(+)